MDVWAGDIELPGGGAIQGVELVAPRTGGPSLGHNSLRFLAVVDLARVPLHLAIGFPLDVFTQRDVTQDWFSALLLGSHAAEKGAEPWWQASMAQSPVGILTEVRKEEASGLSPSVTEVLFYAASSDPSAPTVPSNDGTIYGLKICALPLSSDLLHKIPTVTTPPLSPQLPGFEPDHPSEPAEFLPPLFPTPEVPDPHSRKRQSVSSLFDEAAERRKRARHKGGESISAAASKATSNPAQLPFQQQHKRTPSFSLGLHELFDPQNHAPSRPSSADGAAKRPLSRSPSLGIADPQPRKTDTSKPRSSLSRVTTTTSADASTNEDPTIESRNKDVISRLVMAGMRMHGLEQRKRGRKNSTTSADAAAADPDAAARDEEYKLVYHQAYRGTVFAVRRRIATEPLAPRVELLRETVDKLLAIFCADPLASPPPEAAEAVVASPGPEGRLFGSPAVEGSPFGVRGERLGREAGVSVHTPVTRRSGLGQGG